MEFTTDIKVVVENGNEKSEHTFKAETVSITRATKLWIQNRSNQESDFFENLKMWTGIDKNTGTTSYYSFSTDAITPIEKFRKYFVKSIDEEDQAITFEWI